MDKFIYLDNAATTNVAPEVLDKMIPWFVKNYGNPSSIYSVGRTAKKAVENSRRQVAEAINAKPNEIYFTGSGSEADNWAIKGCVQANLEKSEQKFRNMFQNSPQGMFSFQLNQIQGHRWLGHCSGFQYQIHIQWSDNLDLGLCRQSHQFGNDNLMGNHSDQLMLCPHHMCQFLIG